MSETSHQGTVLEYDAERGYGRIVDVEDRVYFAHFRDLIATQSLQEGQRVQFEAVLHRKGNIARKVAPL